MKFPRQAMRNGDFSAEGVTVVDPLTGQPFPNDTIPSSRVQSRGAEVPDLVSAAECGQSDHFAHAANYIVNRDTSYHSDQYDVRIDQYLTSKQSIFGRWTWKDITALSTNDLLIPSNTNPDNYRLLVLAHNYAIKPNLLNEPRFGMTRQDTGYSNPFNGSAFSQSLGLQGLSACPLSSMACRKWISRNLTGLTADRLQGITHGRTYQAVDNVTWTHGKHTLKVRFRLPAYSGDRSRSGFLGGDNYGNFNFSGQFTDAPFGDFLLGCPATPPLITSRWITTASRITTTPTRRTVSG